MPPCQSLSPAHPVRRVDAPPGGAVAVADEVELALVVLGRRLEDEQVAVTSVRGRLQRRQPPPAVGLNSHLVPLHAPLAHPELMRRAPRAEACRSPFVGALRRRQVDEIRQRLVRAASIAPEVTYSGRLNLRWITPGGATAAATQRQRAYQPDEGRPDPHPWVLHESSPLRPSEIQHISLPCPDLQHLPGRWWAGHLSPRRQRDRRGEGHGVRLAKTCSGNRFPGALV